MVVGSIRCIHTESDPTQNSCREQIKESREQICKFHCQSESDTSDLGLEYTMCKVHFFFSARTLNEGAIRNFSDEIRLKDGVDFSSAGEGFARLLEG